MKGDDFDRAALEIRILVNIVTKMARRDLERRLEAADIGVGALPFSVLRLLSHRDFTISELSRKMILKPATLVPAIDALERHGLVKRSHDPKDRRRTPLLLTERGAEVLSRIPVIDTSDTLFQSLDKMGEEKCRQLSMLLHELASHMSEGEEVVEEVVSVVGSLLKQAGEKSRS